MWYFLNHSNFNSTWYTTILTVLSTRYCEFMKVAVYDVIACRPYFLYLFKVFNISIRWVITEGMYHFEQLRFKMSNTYIQTKNSKLCIPAKQDCGQQQHFFFFNFIVATEVSCRSESVLITPSSTCSFGINCDNKTMYLIISLYLLTPWTRVLLEKLTSKLCS